MKISYGITVHNEAEELLRLLTLLNKHIDTEDEIVVIVDGDDEKVEAILGEQLSENKIKVFQRKLDGDFAAHKNFVIENGARIAQMVLCPIVKAKLKEVKILEDTKRGSGGFGSTGTK